MSDMDYEDFLARLGSGSPVPGGGSASAMVGSISAALSRMVANLTLGKKGYENEEELMKRAATELEKIEKKFLQHSREHEEAFNAISATWKLPKNTDGEKKERKKKMQEATIKALAPPWNIAATAILVLDISKIMIRSGNKNAVSDAACSAEFAIATVKSALHNVKINLSSISDREIVQGEMMKLKLMTEHAESLYESAMNEFNEKISG